MASDKTIHPLALESLFGPAGIAADENGDGYPDRLKVGIRVEPRLSDANLWAQILNLAARLAGEVTALDLPVVKALPRASAGAAALVVHRPSKRHPCEVELRRSARAVHLAGRSAARMAEVLYSLAVHGGRPRGESRPWSSLRVAENEALVLEAFDRRGRGVGRFQLSPARPAAEKKGVERFDLLDLAGALYRVSAENPRAKELALAIELPRLRLSFQAGLALSEAVVRAALEATRVELPLAVSGPGRAGGVVLRVAERPNRGARLSVEKGENASGVIVRAEGDARSLAALLRDWASIGFAAGGPAGEGVRRLRGRIDGLLDMIAAGAPPAARDVPAAVRRRLAWRPETERLIAVVRRVPPGRGVLHGLALVSRPGKARTQVRRDIESILRAKGYAPAIVVLNAYKPGLSWLREVVQPALEAIPRLERVRIAFRGFAPDPPALEMRSRWLQELYPGPDLLATALGLPLERVRLSMRTRQREAYAVTAWDRDGTRVYRAGFTPRASRLPYLPGYPEAGWVHPSTGGIRLTQSGRVLVDESLPTDRERFWRFFQESILPALENGMTDRIADGGGLPTAFWEEAAIDVRIPETDERLGIGEERIAPLEALHEDLYFVLLDHFRLFAEKHGLPVESQFGRILPRVSAAAPRGRPDARFRARPFTQAPASCAVAPAAAARVASIGMEAGRLGFEIEAGQPLAANGMAEELCRRARSRGLDLGIDARTGCFIFRAARPRPPAIVRRSTAKKAAPLAPPLDRLLPMREVGRRVRRLADLPHLSAWQAGTTWQGRGIWALEAVLSGGGGLASLARARLLKPTLLINARHHANEVSSTNAALRLAWELAATPWGREALQRVNVAIVPLENPDGVATLEALLPGCADHKLHAARYNALGAEWYGDYFREPPRFPEARVKPLLWRRWLPLVVLDAHGVPSHEWDQPFSGCAPGRFRQFWIPRAFIYAIVPFIDENSHPGHRPAREISKFMARAIRANQEIQKLDRELKDRYARYARSWDPEVFPPTGGRGLTVLPSEKRLAGMNFGVQRFPVTISEIVTEVTDEVVSGRLLGLCAKAHLAAAKALLGWLGRQAPGRLVRKRSRESGLVLSWEAGKRKR
ncbi:MAG: M14 family metallopeptidase [Desulfobacterales bacterium]|nr:M14 family metallopeptidase [Desulfobacterales bacterium]